MKLISILASLRISSVLLTIAVILAALELTGVTSGMSAYIVVIGIVAWMTRIDEHLYAIKLATGASAATAIGNVVIKQMEERAEG